MTERLWSGNNGRYEVYASFVCIFQDKKVKLRKPNGAFIAVPISLLCDEDIAYITNQSISPNNDSILFSQTLIKPSNVLTIKTTLNVQTQVNAQSANKQISIPINIQTNKPILPAKVIVLIASYLDVQSRIALSTVNKRFHQLIRRSDVWKCIFFNNPNQINDQFLYQLIDYLQFKCDNLHKAIQHAILDNTAITYKSILLLIKYLEYLRTFSIQSCWQVKTFKLAIALTELASNKYPTQIHNVTIGNVLPRGSIFSSSVIESKSFGQDIWFINTALNKIANRNVHLDITLCSSCQLGATSNELYCIFCGFLPLKKCIVCAPRCDRCGTQICGLSTCRNSKIKVQLTKCGRCVQFLGLCNNEQNKSCQIGRKPSPQCHRLFHSRCRINNIEVSNQCLKCGVVACPTCDLITCSGECHGQWCKQCLPSIQFIRCKCILIHGNSSKTISKRNICSQCQKSCQHCGLTSFCTRCLNVHQEKCK